VVLKVIPYLLNKLIKISLVSFRKHGQEPGRPLVHHVGSSEFAESVQSQSWICNTLNDDGTTESSRKVCPVL